MPSYSLFGVPVTILSRVADVPLDAVLQCTVHEDNLVTANPVEDGSDLADHILAQPVEISLTARLTDTPLSGGKPGEPGDSEARRLGLSGGPAHEKWKALEALRNSRTPLAVVVQQGAYEDMAFVNLEAPRKPGDGFSQEVSLRLRQIRSAPTQDAAGQQTGAPPGARRTINTGIRAAVPF